MLVTIRWETPNWYFDVQREDGVRSRFEAPSELESADGRSLEAWAKETWPRATIEFEEYLT